MDIQKHLVSLLRKLGASKITAYEYGLELKARNNEGSKAFQSLKALIDTSNATQLDLAKNLSALSPKFATLRDAKTEKKPTLPYWNNGFLPPLDMMVLYTILKQFKPKHYIEVGSGNSTKVARWCINEEQLHTRITSIDPYPRAEIDNLAHKIIRKGFQNINLSEVLTLEKGDILFIDNSHTAYANSDVTVFFTEVLPFLNNGVIVHIHDIYLPYDYPEFMAKRMYNEQYLLSTALLCNPEKFEVLAANYYLSKNEEFQLACTEVWKLESLKNCETHGGSFWFVIK